MKQPFAVVGGLLFVASLLFFAASYAWRFAETRGPWSVAAAWGPITINIVLFTLFALHHSIFARTGARDWIRRVAPPELERSIYVWISSVMFFAVCLWWQPVPGVIWKLSGISSMCVLAGQSCAAVFTVLAARRLDVLELAGIRQVGRATPSAALEIHDRGPYGLVRHPIYLGWFGMVWLTSVMNGTRLVFAVVSCAYLVVAIPFEERELRRTFSTYTEYSRRVRWKILPGVY